MKTIAWTVLSLLASTPAFADEVRLKSGGVLVGLVREEGERVVVELAAGSVGFARADVQEIIPGRTAMHDYWDRMADAQKSGTAEGYFDLAKWAEASGISRDISKLLKRTLELETEHVGAKAWVESLKAPKVAEVKPPTNRTVSQRKRRRPEPEPSPYTLGLAPTPTPRRSHSTSGGLRNFYFGW